MANKFILSQENKINEALARRVVGYPNEYYHTLVHCYALDREISNSKVITEAVKEKFDRLPRNEIERLLRKKNKF